MNNSAPVRQSQTASDAHKFQVSTPLVSVIIPTFNYAHFIVQTLENLQNQSYRNWEAVIVDDGSTDNTADIIKLFAARDLRIRYVYQNNQHLAAARNTGLRHARGTYIQFLDSDDFIERCKLENHVAYLETHGHVDIVYSEARFFTAAQPHEYRLNFNGTDKAWMPLISGCKTEIIAPLIYGNIMVVNSPVLRRHVIERVGWFDTACMMLEDWDYWMRCAIAGCRFQFLAADETLALVRSHPTSMSKNRHLMYKEVLRLRARFTNLIDEAQLIDAAALHRINKSLIAYTKGLLGIEEINAGNTHYGRKLLLQAMRGSRKFSSKVKWCTCAMMSPFVTPRRLARVAAYSPADLLAAK